MRILKILYNNICCLTKFQSYIHRVFVISFSENMAQIQTDQKVYYNIDNPSTNDQTYEELRPLNQIYDEISQKGRNTISQDYDDVAPESRYPPTRLQAIYNPDARVGGPPSPHPTILTEPAVVKKVDLRELGLKVKAILAAFGLSVVVLIAAVVLLYIFHGKKTFSDAQNLYVFNRRIDDFVKGWFSIYGGSG